MGLPRRLAEPTPKDKTVRAPEGGARTSLQTRWLLAGEPRLRNQSQLQVMLPPESPQQTMNSAAHWLLVIWPYP
jgi:hypothetical protein